jgi:hypothetical protein
MLRELKESRLSELESLIASGAAGGLALRFERACLLAETGDFAGARDAYIDLLSRDPSHLAALNNLGTLLYEAGYRTAARTAYREAAERHPADAMSRVNLGNALQEIGDFAGAHEHYEKALRLEPEHAEAHQGLARVLSEWGDALGADRHRRLGYGKRPVVTLRYRGQGSPVPLLVLEGTAGGNIPLRHFIDDRVFLASFVFVEYFDPAARLPEHRLVFNAIGDADAEGPALRAAAELLKRTAAPVINSPNAVAVTGRSDNARQLAAIPGVISAGAVDLPRALVTVASLAGLGFEFPLLVRTPGFHTGRHFVRVEKIEELAGAVAGLPGDELTVMRYLDARGPDGKSRKYRVMMINGELYPLHLAISGDWKIHYFTAEMGESAQHRAEDHAFLEDMPGVLGPVAMGALREIQARLGLDYAGIDFGLNARGEVLLFEANATMVVNRPEADEKWAYRRPAVERIFAAVRNMLVARSTA